MTAHIMNDIIGSSVSLAFQLPSKAHFGPIDLSSYTINIQQRALWPESRNSEGLVQMLGAQTEAALASLGLCRKRTAEAFISVGSAPPVPINP